MYMIHSNTTHFYFFQKKFEIFCLFFISIFYFSKKILYCTMNHTFNHKRPSMLISHSSFYDHYKHYNKDYKHSISSWKSKHSTTFNDNDIYDFDKSSTFSFSDTSLFISNKIPTTGISNLNHATNQFANDSNKQKQSKSHLNHSFSKNPQRRNSTIIYSSFKKKCSIVNLGGVQDEIGICNGSFHPKCCSRLRCTRCNFIVLRFSNRSWISNVHYLFFRTVFPDTQALQSKLKYSSKSVSYCCQCSWITMQGLTNIKQIKETKLRWICAGHL